MFDDANEILKENQDCLKILRHYARVEKPSEGEESSNWSQRLYHQVGQTEQVEHSEEETTDPTSEAHGLLIAYGYLDIELVGRDAGIHYRLSSAGKKLLAQVDKQTTDQEDQRRAG